MSFQKQQPASFEDKVTAKGTRLPIMNLKGKPYLQVAHRLVWFREEHPTGQIETKLLRVDEKECVAQALIFVDGKCISSGHKKETEAHFGDFIEKAETGAIGRALAMAGYGTQFEPELEEGERIVDAPMHPAKKGKTNEPAANQPSPKEPVAASARPGAGPANPTRDEVLMLIREAARVVVAKKVLGTDQASTTKALSEYLKNTFQVGSKEELTDERLATFLTYLKSLV